MGGGLSNAAWEGIEARLAGQDQAMTCARAPAKPTGERRAAGMVDVFISYARREIDRARPINETLQGFGLTTFFDIEGLDGSDEFPDEIDRALRAAQCVVGVWSPHALSRPWVKKEARVAASLQRLITVRIAPLVLEAHSTEFSGRHVSDLESFAGDVDHPGFLELMKAIAEKLNRPGLKQLVQMAARKAGPEVAPRAEAQAPAQAPSGPADSPSARAWAQIAQSLDGADYGDFVTHFSGSPEAFEAGLRKRKLEAWGALDKADPAAIAAFLREPGFAALEAQAKAAMHQAAEARQRAERAAEEARQQAFARALAERQAAKEAQEAARKAEEEPRAAPRRAAEAAKAGRPVAERAFAIELPGVSGWPNPQMIAIPPGRFVMGAPESEEGSQDGERPQHEVTIAYPFAMGQHAVTFAQWDAALAAGAKLEKPGDRGWGRGDRPVINVSWEDAQAYLAWLNDKAGLTGRPDAYRLPSEAEWEYACRAKTQIDGTATPFSFGETISTDQANYDGNFIYGSGKKGEYRQKTLPVGSFPANPFGLHEMHGNVWEWCEDSFHNTYDGAPADGSAWVGKESSYRVYRGGSWDNDPADRRSANRSRDTPTYRNSDVGFRVARTFN